MIGFGAVLATRNTLDAKQIALMAEMRKIDATPLADCGAERKPEGSLGDDRLPLRGRRDTVTTRRER
jgi:hypothetical protein